MKFIPKHDTGWIDGRGYRKQPLLLPEDLHCPGALVQIVEIPPGDRCPEHHHKQMTEVFHMLEGKGIITVGGTAHALGPGDTLTCEPGESHGACNPHAETFRYVVFKMNWSPEDTFW